jgi:hypothetical protein
LGIIATDLRLVDRLEGALNFVPWKARVTLILVGEEDKVGSLRGEGLIYWL